MVGRSNYGEAAVVGGNRLFVCSPPAGKPLTGGNRQLRSAGRSSELVVGLGRVQLRGANAGRRRVRGGRPNSGKAAMVGGNRLFGCFPPAERLLPGGNRQLGRDLL